MNDIKRIQEGLPMTRRQKFMLAARLAMPAILAQLSSIMMQYIDASMVGRLGTGPSASVGLMSSSLWLFWGICSMATMGFSVQVAHCLGAREHEKARSVMRQGFTSVGIFSVLMALLGVAIAPSLPHWLGGDESVAADATLYFTVFVAALPMLTLNYICGGMLRCAGQMKVPSLLNVLMCLLDIVFNFFLIFPTREMILFGSPVVVPGAGLGVLGAALGTVFAEVVVAVLMCYYLCWR
ncbi:MAG: MATE family efflux transporter, partial [Muribaculaceae bacterium]|nr:MATE family efflux transporter [Muribaculaceae bacterium]